MKRNLLKITDLSVYEIDELFCLADLIKEKHKKNEVYTPLKGKTVGMLFKKLSTRTRISFEVGIYKLGGNALFLSGKDIQMDRGETVSDSARIFSQYMDGIIIRTFKQEEIEEVAQHASIPVINGLTSKYHPCQILSDIYTIKKRYSDLSSIKAAFIGDGNNIANSLLLGAAMVGMNIVSAHPKGYEPDESILKEVYNIQDKKKTNIEITNDPVYAAKEADVIYTDVWTSMGQEEEAVRRREDFREFQINSKLLKTAKSGAVVMHCLPACRGEEITSEVIDGPQSIVWMQAKNRLYVQNAIMDFLLGEKSYKE